MQGRLEAGIWLQKGEKPMKTIEDYKQAVANAPSDVMADKFIAQADADGYDIWALAELVGIRTELWA